MRISPNDSVRAARFVGKMNPDMRIEDSGIDFWRGVQQEFEKDCHVIASRPELSNMKISDDAIIPIGKPTQYLLIPRPWDDKSKFLAQANFSQDNPGVLLDALRDLAARSEADEDGSNEYGTFYRN